MNNYIDNINMYIAHYGIKQSFLSLKSGIQKDKLNRLLNQKQEISAPDMERIAKALGKSAEYFLKDMNLKSIDYTDSTSIAFYMGKPTKEIQEFSNKVFDFLEHVDIIVGMNKKIKKYSSKVVNNGF